MPRRPPGRANGASSAGPAEFNQGFDKRLFENGQLRRFVNVFANGEDVRHLKGLDTPVEEKDEVSILPAVSGG